MAGSRYPSGPRKTLIAGIGNVLRCDDGFGPAVIRELEILECLPAGTHTVEVGIGGIGLVLELIDGYETLIVVDAVDRGGLPGTLYILEPHVPEPSSLQNPKSRELGMDMHQVGPGNALIMARALGVLPPVVRFVGCQPGETEVLTTELSQPVQAAIPYAVQIILSLLDTDQVDHHALS